MRDDPELERVSIDLSERLDTAVLSTPVRVIDFGNLESKRFLSSGWGPLDGRSGSAWTEARSAVVELPVVGKGKLELKIDLASPSKRDFPMLPGQSVEVVWNGHSLGEFPLPRRRHRLRVEIPEEFQILGPNRLELRPLYWFTPGAIRRDRGGPSSVGVRCFRIEISQDAMARPDPAATRSHPRGIDQAPGSVVTWYLPLPGRASLRGRVRLANGEAAVPGSVRAVASVVDSGGRERVLLQAEEKQLANGAGLELAMDLSDLAGGIVALNLAFSALEGREDVPLQVSPIALHWEGLRIEGEKEADPESAIPKGGGRNIFVIVFDTLRADHAEPYASASPRTPALARLASRGITFRSMRSNAPWTRPSVTSLLTSFYPGAHRVNGDADTLPPDVPYLPEILAQHRFRSLAVVNNPQIAASLGYGRGFQEVHEIFREGFRKESDALDAPEDRAALVWSRVIEPFLRRDADRPFFIYLHEIDPHDPYTPRAPYDSLYGFGYTGNIKSKKEILRLIIENKMKLDAADWAHLRSQYAGEVSFMDAYLGWMLERLEEVGLGHDTVVVFTSDHGEEFNEHGSIGHKRTLYEELLRVPLVISLPGTLPEGARVERSVQSVDVVPTLLELVGLEVPDQLQGRSLLPFLNDGQNPWPSVPTFAGTDVDGRRLESVQFGKWKLIKRTWHAENLPGSVQLFDLQRDPHESIDLWPHEPIVGMGLLEILAIQDRRNHERHAVAGPAVGVGELDPEVREGLRALGYIR